MIHDIVAARAAEQRQREAARARTPLQLAWRQLRRYKLALISGAALAVIYVIMLFAEFVAPYGLDFTDRDLLYRMLDGSRVLLLIGIIVVLITFPIGLVLGGIAGYYGGIIDNVLMRAVEVLASFPTFYLLLTLATVLPATLSSAARIFMIAAVFSLVGWGGLARIIRGLVLSLRELEFVLAARAAGLSDLRVIVRHILPSTSSYVIVAAARRGSCRSPRPWCSRQAGAGCSGPRSPRSRRARFRPRSLRASPGTRPPAPGGPWSASPGRRAIPG